MIVAMLSTKIALYLGTSPLPLPPAPPRIGFWAVLHAVRSEYAQALVVAFLLINGPGRWSLDALFRRASEEGGWQRAGARFRQQSEAKFDGEKKRAAYAGLSSAHSVLPPRTLARACPMRSTYSRLDGVGESIRN